MASQASTLKIEPRQLRTGQTGLCTGRKTACATVNIDGTHFSAHGVVRYSKVDDVTTEQVSDVGHVRSVDKDVWAAIVRSDEAIASVTTEGLDRAIFDLI